MSAIYGNWERLVAAVVKREQLWQLFHTDSISTYSNSSLQTSDRHTSSWISKSDSPYHQTKSLSAVVSSDVVRRKGEVYDEKGVVIDHQYPRCHSLFLDYEAMKSSSDEVVLQSEVLETLRKERFAIPYRSSMVDNGKTTTVVKRLRGAGVVDVAPNKVFFCCEDEVLIIYEYESQSGVSVFLQHGKKNDGIYKLQWESRVRIAICVAKAMANTHSRYNSNHVPTETKTSDDGFSDLGLEEMEKVTIVVPTVGYHAPEADYGRPSSQSSDIYSFGVLLLELLTGAFPMNIGNIDDIKQLVRRVNDKFIKAGTLIVFDFVPVRNAGELIEMWKMLAVAMMCLQEKPDRRPNSSYVVKMMEGIKECPS